MASDRVKTLFEEVESLSDSYAEVTTALSKQIVAFEERLNSLKGKVEVEVKSSKGLMLRFGRVESGRWGLLVGSFRNSLSRLPASDVSQKMTAVALFETLLGQMVHVQRMRKDEAEAACAFASSMLSQLGIDVETEGK